MQTKIKRQPIRGCSKSYFLKDTLDKPERFNTEITEKAPRYNEILGAFSVISVLNLSGFIRIRVENRPQNLL